MSGEGQTAEGVLCKAPEFTLHQLHGRDGVSRKDSQMSEEGQKSEVTTFTYYHGNGLTFLQACELSTGAHVETQRGSTYDYTVNVA